MPIYMSLIGFALLALSIVGIRYRRRLMALTMEIHKRMGRRSLVEFGSGDPDGNLLLPGFATLTAISLILIVVPLIDILGQ